MHQERELMHQEWLAWTEGVCAELKELDIEPNAPTSDRLMRSIELWGERLVALRSEQSADLRAVALADKYDKFCQAKG